MPLAEFSDSGFDSGHSFSGGSHLFGRVVGMTSGTVPVSGEGLGVEGGLTLAFEPFERSEEGENGRCMRSIRGEQG